MCHVTHHHPLTTPLPWGAAGAARRIGAQNARFAMLQKRCLRGHTARTSTRACAAGSRLCAMSSQTMWPTCCRPRALAAPLEERSACGRRGEKRLDERLPCPTRHARRTAGVLLTSDDAKASLRCFKCGNGFVWSDCASRGGCELRRPGGRRSPVRLSARAPRPFIRSRESPPVPLFRDCILKRHRLSHF